MDDKLREFLKRREFDRIEKPSLVLQFLYDADEFYRFRGAEALGHLCKGNVARNFILRLFWHLSDESGAYCIGAPLGIAEIGRNNPGVFEGFKNKFVSLIDDWEVEKKYVVYGIGRTAKIVRDAYPNPLEKLKEVLKNEKNPEVLAYTLTAVVEFGERAFVDLIKPLTERSDAIVIYDVYNGEMKTTTLGSIARLALKSLERS